MGNTVCPAVDISLLTSIARDVCPFPDYTPSPLFTNMLSVNSSRHLSDHFTAVQSSLNSKQLQHFTQSLRSTFGREGRVSYGGVGVVALSLAVLFDTLAKQAKGERVSDSGPIPGLFFKDPRGYYPPHVHTVSEYLRLVPHIANNPTRMKEEAESAALDEMCKCLSGAQKLTELLYTHTDFKQIDPRYSKRLTDDDHSLENLKEKDMFAMQETIPLLNTVLGKGFGINLRVHLLRLKKASIDDLGHPRDKQPTVLILNLNCDLETAEEAFKAQIQRLDNSTQDTYRSYMDQPKPWLVQVAELALIDTMFQLVCKIGFIDEFKFAQKGDFDLKANALGKWGE